MSESLKYLFSLARESLFGYKYDKSTDLPEKDKVYKLEDGTLISRSTCEDVVKSVFGKGVNIASLKVFLYEKSSTLQELNETKYKLELLRNEVDRLQEVSERKNREILALKEDRTTLQSRMEDQRTSSVARIRRDEFNETFILEMFDRNGRRIAQEVMLKDPFSNQF